MDHIRLRDCSCVCSSFEVRVCAELVRRTNKRRGIRQGFVASFCTCRSKIIENEMLVYAWCGWVRCPDRLPLIPPLQPYWSARYRQRRPLYLSLTALFKNCYPYFSSVHCLDTIHQNVYGELAAKTEVRSLLSVRSLYSRSCREWVAKCLGQMTDANREEAQTELKQVIAESYANKTLWTTDWDGVQLKRCASSRR